MKSILEYLGLDESERHFFDTWAALPPELLPLFEKMLDGNRREFEEAEAALRAIYEERQKNK